MSETTSGPDPDARTGADEDEDVLYPEHMPRNRGNGPIIAAAALAGGACLAAGIGFAHMAMSDGGIPAALGKEKPAAEAPAHAGSDDDIGSTNPDGSVTVTLPDTNGNGVPDMFEGDDRSGRTYTYDGEGHVRVDDGDDKSGDDSSDSSSDPKGSGKNSEGSSDGHGSSGDSSSRSDDANEKEAPEVYKIQKGDTLSEISGDTGVPIDILMEENHIKNPDLIFAGSSLLIPASGTVD